MALLGLKGSREVYVKSAETAEDSALMLSRLEIGVCFGDKGHGLTSKALLLWDSSIPVWFALDPVPRKRRSDNPFPVSNFKLALQISS